MLGLIERNFNLLCRDSFVMLYKSMVRSHLEYANAHSVETANVEIQKNNRRYDRSV